MIPVNRYLILFRSHHDDPSDIHVVDAREESPLKAIRKAQCELPPLHDWVSVRVWNWPRNFRGGVVEAAEKLASVKVG